MVDVHHLHGSCFVLRGLAGAARPAGHCPGCHESGIPVAPRRPLPRVPRHYERDLRLGHLSGRRSGLLGRCCGPAHGLAHMLLGLRRDEPLGLRIGAAGLRRSGQAASVHLRRTTPSPERGGGRGRPHRAAGAARRTRARGAGGDVESDGRGHRLASGSVALPRRDLPLLRGLRHPCLVALRHGGAFPGGRRPLRGVELDDQGLCRRLLLASRRRDLRQITCPGPRQGRRGRLLRGGLAAGRASVVAGASCRLQFRDVHVFPACRIPGRRELVGPRPVDSARRRAPRAPRGGAGGVLLADSAGQPAADGAGIFAC
mmetsp:Transcript_165278/g.530495  ORF Transcript_165278/g.530495 Transcript_165278/m.530495 type:complete len:315 (-) Transcript_165278:192-1136(-)